ncbi:SDR family NAD(P)-dependent oxidoreductase [Rudanella paleaurantiibacter]|uniref:SDR family NAD(P)-dependent oxidoreductase n=1 Tax=Rudanella paleaurantiibacter TaxID=2614655 RepID=A0A7J5U2R6_9BACT|nr:SDR family NAD(P)-dependent oxidoreductase [Rudanella paleaurantiibacter]KAB7731284.1 SDR family NAD(P)-dependent oxidoreductase [Rudanella paleaurantiibacter]
MKKRALITGANSGIGLSTARALAHRGFDLILLVRNETKGREAQAEIQKANPNSQADLVQASLDDADSVQRAAEHIKTTYDRIDVLINNAGYTPAKLEFTDENIERSFYASHVGHFALTWYLSDILKKTAAQTGDVRIITLSSAAHMGGRVDRMFRRIDTLSPMLAYCDDKLANLLFAKGAAKHFEGTGVRSFSVHPGAVKTNFASDTKGIGGAIWKLMSPFLRTPERGAETSIFLAAAPLKSIGERNNGAYFVDMAPKTPRNRDVTDKNVQWLWEKSLKFV